MGIVAIDKEEDGSVIDLVCTDARHLTSCTSRGFAINAQNCKELPPVSRRAVAETHGLISCIVVH